MSDGRRLGWIGTGNMGGPMAARLCAAGHPVTICGSGRRDLSAYAEETGARLAHSPKEVAEQADILFTMIPNGEILLDIISGENGLDSADLNGKILVDMSTVDPASSEEAARRMAAHGGHLLRAPVTGSTHFAKNGTLGIMVSGEQDVFETCLPYLKVLGNRQTYLGDGEQARYMKIIINMMLAQALQSFSEGLVLGEKLGLPWETMIDLIGDSAAAAPIMQYKADTMKRRDFTPTSTCYNMHKDMKMAMALAQQVNASLPAASLTMQLYNTLMAMGLRDKDNTAILLANERLNALDQSEG
ncbi:MAG: NAD(P)-dependent oxidoreductase [Agathobaculum sp.]|jgi:3-hydroxyisobutyrate dehydrogenase-like beta-hydroxyacid dehydrogenase|uniref:NAD(P)-dependent oxidoreductase n=1 Tax=Agathobaculum sp. TaxID=2048138 RepID=UPI003D8C5E5B